MNIGIFDSGLGGLIITKSLIDAMPDCDFVYLGDTANVPYGSKSSDEIYNMTYGCIDYLFRIQDCGLIIIACNTASIATLRKLQQTYVPQNFPDRKILGMVFPTVEEVIKKEYKTVGLIATQSTVNSDLYPNKFLEIKSGVKVVQLATPKIVEIVESGRDDLASIVIEDYISQLQKMNPDIEAIVLGCTHYPYYKNLIKSLAGKIFARKIDIISQDEIIADSLKIYLKNHSEIDCLLSHNSSRKFLATSVSDAYKSQSKIIMGHEIKIEKINL